MAGNAAAEKPKNILRGSPRSSAVLRVNTLASADRTDLAQFGHGLVSLMHP